MDDKDIDKIACAIADKVQPAPHKCSLHNEFQEWKEVHSTHHEFISMEIERRQNRAEMVDKFKKSFVGAIATGLFASLVWIGKIVLEYAQRNI